MKAHKILLFILSVIAMLALLCSFFPRDGISIGDVNFRFPSIEDILLDEEDDGESPEALLLKRQNAIMAARKSDLLAYFASDPARIYFPGGDLTYLDPVFAALDRAGEEHMRILHYGDSQIEEDRISSVLRDSLQTRFGGGGPGLLPVREKYYTLRFSETSTLEPARYLIYGTPEQRTGNGRYGVMGQKAHYDTTVTTSFHPLKGNEGPSRYFNRVTMLTSGGAVSLYCKGQKLHLEASQDVRHATFELPDSTERISLTHSGSHDIYGIMLDNANGVSLDNIPMRGCAGTIFSSLSSSQLEDFLSGENVRLIILQYGGNVVPYTSTEKSISQYRESISKQIVLLRRLAPQARILFVGPSDMSTSIQGKMQTYSQLPSIVEALKGACMESGAAFWDMYSAMGGSGSMKKWVTSQPPLAGSDYVHFTPKGAEKMGGMLYEALMLYYDYYKIRTHE